MHWPLPLDMTVLTMFAKAKHVKCTQYSFFYYKIVAPIVVPNRTSLNAGISLQVNKENKKLKRQSQHILMRLGAMEIDLTEESDDGETEVDGRDKVEDQQEHWNHMIEGKRFTCEAILQVVRWPRGPGSCLQLVKAP